MKTTQLKFFYFFLPVLLIGLGFSSCFPDLDLTADEYDVVATDYDPDYFNSNTPMTYHMPDTIVNIGDPDGEEDPQLSRGEMDFILAQVKRNLAAFGYESVPKIEEGNLPDVVVTVSAVVVKTTAIGGGCYPWYPGWGWYPWYPGWGWGGGGCYPVYAYSYTTGTVVIDMIDPSISNGGNFPRVWNAGINGLLRSSNASNQSFITKTIDQAFAQSETYLKQ